MRAGQMTRALRDERHGKPEATLQDEGDKSDEMDTFWSHLGGDGPIKSASAGGSDAAAAAEAAESVKLFRLSDKSGSLNFSLEKTGNLSKSDLDSSDAFLLDNGAEVFVWIGKRASHLEKKKVSTVTIVLFFFMLTSCRRECSTLSSTWPTTTAPLICPSHASWTVARTRV